MTNSEMGLFLAPCFPLFRNTYMTSGLDIEGEKRATKVSYFVRTFLDWGYLVLFLVPVLKIEEDVKSMIRHVIKIMIQL